MELTPYEIEAAFQYWFSQYEFRKIDIEIEKLLAVQLRSDWIFQVRKAQYLSAKKLANKLQISQQACAKLEKSESLETITIQSLRIVANALDCEFVYGFRPKIKQKLARQIWEKLYLVSKDHLWIQKCVQSRRAQALAAVARMKMKDPEVKKKLLHF